MKLTPLNEIDEDRKFFKGTVLRFYYHDEDYYDYLLASAPWEKDMMAVNITEDSIKRGYVYAGVIPVTPKNNEFAVVKKGFQHAFGKNLDGWFLLEK